MGSTEGLELGVELTSGLVQTMETEPPGTDGSGGYRMATPDANKVFCQLELV